jgi:hypothetical protein
LELDVLLLQCCSCIGTALLGCTVTAANYVIAAKALCDYSSALYAARCCTTSTAAAIIGADITAVAVAAATIIAATAAHYAAAAFNKLPIGVAAQ